MGLTNAEIDLVATQVVERLNEENLLLHSVPYIHGSPGLVVDEARAKATPCRCVEYAPDKRLCWSAGIIGAMTDAQELEYCPTIYDISRPGTVERMRKWRESVDVCKGELARIPEASGEERVTTWLRCMSSALSTSSPVNPGNPSPPIYLTAKITTNLAGERWKVITQTFPTLEAAKEAAARGPEKLYGYGYVGRDGAIQIERTYQHA